LATPNYGYEKRQKELAKKKKKEEKLKHKADRKTGAPGEEGAGDDDSQPDTVLPGDTPTSDAPPQS
jgi:hypothetical protein